MNTYTTKTNARRAAKAKLGAHATEGIAYKIIESGRGFRYKAITKEPSMHTLPSSAQQKPMTCDSETNTFQGKSTIPNPVQRVWAIAESMPTAPRKRVVAEAVRQGVAFFTARTQYQKWRTQRRAADFLPTSPVR